MTSNLIDNRIADKITSTSKDSSQNALNIDENELEIPKKKKKKIHTSRKKVTNY